MIAGPRKQCALFLWSNDLRPDTSWQEQEASCRAFAESFGYQVAWVGHAALGAPDMDAAFDELQHRLDPPGLDALVLCGPHAGDGTTARLDALLERAKGKGMDLVFPTPTAQMTAPGGGNPSSDRPNEGG